MRDALGLFAAILKLALALSASGCTVMLAPEAVHVPAPEVTPEPAPAPDVEVPADLPDDASRPEPCEALRAELSAAQAKLSELESRPAAVTTEADYWDSLAALVESGRVTDTDVLLKMAEMLKADGKIVDDARLSTWRPLGARELIGDGNRASIAAKVRGN